jgi:hypothetical protein
MVEVSDVPSRVAEVRSQVASLNGKLDRVFLSVREEQARADISMRVFAKDFDQAVAALEGLGKVKVKELHQGQTPVVKDAPLPEQPDSYVQLSLVKPAPVSRTWLWWAIGGPVGGLALVALIVVAVFRSLGRRAV